MNDVVIMKLTLRLRQPLCRGAGPLRKVQRQAMLSQVTCSLSNNEGGHGVPRHSPTTSPVQEELSVFALYSKHCLPVF